MVDTFSFTKLATFQPVGGALTTPAFSRVLIIEGLNQLEFGLCIRLAIYSL
jgi:hypothetical protein